MRKVEGMNGSEYFEIPKAFGRKAKAASIPSNAKGHRGDGFKNRHPKISTSVIRAYEGHRGT